MRSHEIFDRELLWRSEKSHHEGADYGRGTEFKQIGLHPYLSYKVQER